MKRAITSLFSTTLLALAACTAAPEEAATEGAAALGEDSMCAAATPDCAMGDVEWVTAGCSNGTTRMRACTSLCSWTSYGSCEPLPTGLDIIENRKSAIATVSIDGYATKLLGRCPTVELDLAYVLTGYLPVRNHRNVPVTVNLTATGAAGVELAVYPTGSAATSASERKACIAEAKITDGFTGARAITIPASRTYLVYFQQAQTSADPTRVTVQARIAP